MEERELLELAALAAALEVEWNASSGYFEYIPKGRRGYVRWKPHEDDGDCLRLAVKVGMLTSANRDHCRAKWCGDHGVVEYFDWHDNDPNEAMRYAVLKAAAQKGKYLRDGDVPF